METALEVQNTLPAILTIQDELEVICDQHNGILRAEDVIEYAKDESSLLHGRFTWDDNIAAHNFRLLQARQIINVHVYTPPTFSEPVRVFVSLMDDRHQPGGGYRRMSDVMANPILRNELLKQALREAKSWREKFIAVKELGPVYAELDRVEKEIAPS